MTVIPVYNNLILPNAVVFLNRSEIGPRSAEDLEIGKRVILLSLRKPESFESLRESSFYPVGVSGVVCESHVEGMLAVRTSGRVDVESVHVMPDLSIQLTAVPRSDIDDLSAEDMHTRLRQLKTRVIRFGKNIKGGEMINGFISRWASFEEAGSAFSMWLGLSAEDRYAILAQDSTAARAGMIEAAMYEMLEIAEVSIQAKNVTEEESQNNYRENAIRRQIEYLQSQLDEMHPEEISDTRLFEKKIAESGMNDTARREAEKVLTRMQQEGKHNNEYGMLYDYLDFVTGLNWKAAPMKRIDLAKAEQVLEEDHFGLKKVKDRILQQIAVMNLNKKQSGSILLFVGAPGTGKTSIGQSIARALKREYVRISLGGVRDEADIRGHRRTYLGAMPGRIMDGIHKCGAGNPVVVLDEVDKLCTSYNGDPASALLEVLDPEQNFSFTDHYMNCPYDLSNVFFICTPNTTATIPEPLLNRMEVINFPGYTATDKYQIAVKHLLPKAMKSTGIRKKDLQISDEAIRTIISDYTMESGVRGLKKRLDTLCRIAAVNLVKGKGKAISVTEENLKEYLDAKPIRHGHIIPDTKAGIITGLAWTAAGGDILFIETALLPGKGHIHLTGQLGDVMKESASIAVTLVKNMYPETTALFEDHDLHIHFPEGAIKKDGPSAGITLVTALSSLVLNKPVDPAIAMTGEVSLRGKVMPIGGLPEKLMAAQRAGVKTVLIPEDNVTDLDDVADEIKEKLNIVPVKEISDVLKATGLIKKPARKKKAE
ncbi:MAG: endopeptidase La [Oscillospiraceae bacterium]|nr:endopeptidase La [Oscillospiraceae bacterium]